MFIIAILLVVLAACVLINYGLSNYKELCRLLILLMETREDAEKNLRDCATLESENQVLKAEITRLYGGFCILSKTGRCSPTEPLEKQSALEIENKALKEENKNLKEDREKVLMSLLYPCPRITEYIPGQYGKEKE